MIQFRERDFSEHDAMNYFYDQLMRSGGDRNKWKIIDSSALIPILKGNNIVITKFTIVSDILGREKYRMHIRIGAKARLPEDVRLPKGPGYDKRIGSVGIKFNNPGLKSFSDNNNNKKGGGGGDFGSMSFSPNIEISRHVNGEELGKAISYDKTTRELVMEYKSVYDAIKSLNILPFGFGYRIYILDTK